jgi:ATP adenylyltransferase
LTRKQIDIDRYIRSTQTKPCFICGIVAQSPGNSHHIVYQDEQAIVFLNKYPMLYGYVLIAPREHREQVTGDFTVDEYLDLQRLIHKVAEAVRQEVPTERVYIFSFGSQQGNSHGHWHIAPLPPGVPYEQQQFQAVMLENGILDLPDDELANLATRIGRRITAEDAENCRLV